MQLLKQSTAATQLVGPVLDSSGNSFTTAVIGDFSITKNGTTSALASAATATHVHNGCYAIALTTENTNTLGGMDISCNKSGYAMSVHRYQVVPFDPVSETRGFAGTALPNAAAGAAGGLYSPIRKAGTAGSSSTVSRVYLGSMSGGTNWNYAKGSIIVVGSVARIITGGHDGENVGTEEYVDVAPDFAVEPDGETYVILYAIAPVVDSSLRVKALDSNGVVFDSTDLGASAAEIWAYASRTLSAGQSIVVETQQFTQLELVRGNSYDSSARALTVARSDDAVWPTDTSDGWTWAFYASKHGSNKNSSAPATFSGTVSVVTATGDDQTFQITILAADIADALGAYDYAIRGTKTGKVWDTVLGTLLIRDSAAEA